MDATLNKMVVIMKATSKTMLPMAMANISIGQGIDMKGNGKITCPMARARPYIQTRADTMENF